MKQVSFRNKIIQKFTNDAFVRLRDDLEPIQLKVRDVITRPNTPITHVYFLESGQISVLAKVQKSEPIEVGIIGREGMSDMAINGRTPLESLCQVAGDSHRIERATFIAAMAENKDLADLMLRYQQFMIVQLSFTALSHGSFTVDERLARWLLMVHDRVDGDEIPLVHDFFSWMLAVRRAGVTDSFRTLRSHGCIETGRGLVRIIDRDMLIELASGSYGPAEAEYQKLLG